MRKLSQVLRIVISILFILVGLLLVILMSIFFKGLGSVVQIVNGLFLIACAVLLLKNKWRTYPIIIGMFVLGYFETTAYRYFFIEQRLSIVDLQNIPFYLVPALLLGFIWKVENSLPDQNPTTFQLAANQKYAGFFERFFAYVTDGLIISVPIAILYLTIAVFTSVTTGVALTKTLTETENSMLFSICALAIAYSYYIFFTKTRGATFGKRTLHLTVVSADGTNLSWGKVIVRETIGKIISGILYIGYIVMVFSPRKQTWHDKMAGTLVIGTISEPIQQSAPPVVNTPASTSG